MRGKAVNAYVTFLHVGITPAYAGKSWLAHDYRRKIRDHPRLCGEKAQDNITPHEGAGSPPPMRGKALELNGASELIGITPAYAGKSLSSIIYTG